MRRGSTLLEFALAWPVCLLLVTGCIQLSIWGAEMQAARQAALAGARAGSAPGAEAGTAQAVAMAALGRSLVGVRPRSWCPGRAGPAPPVWVCSTISANQVEVRVGGSVPALLPLLPGGGLPIGADVIIGQESFRP